MADTSIRTLSKHRILGAFLLTAVLVAGCGGGGDDDSAGGTTVPSSAPPSTTPAPATTAVTVPTGPDPVLQAKAEAAILQPDDFPLGWTEQPQEEGLFIELLWQELTTCLGVYDPSQVKAKATSPTFLRGIATQARSTVTYTAPASADAIAAALEGPMFQECATPAFDADVERSKPDGSTHGPSAVAPIETLEIGQKTLSWRVNVTVFLSDLEVRINQNFLVVFEPGGVVIPLFFLNPGSPFPPELQQQLIDKVTSRAAL